ncbi:MAG TPA: TIGR03752 family integrating conjugative element protein, partial [Alicycliphilus sp.]|nr:TIGR03752 family integrating conjugative element protein [Alicycliphilus sp.]
ADEATAEAAGAVRYSVLPPMGYAVQTEPARGQNAPPMMRYVRTMHTEGPGTTTAPADGPASQAARAAQDRREPVPYFTLPENATLAGATAMTALIGRVPIDGRVTDPMQFKAVIGRDNLAANGFELPGDVSGMIVTGVAIGDMALSCSEGRVRSVTFVFNDGSIQTVSARGAGSRSINTGAGASSNSDLGFISDLHGNPCITGKFVTNAPAYLTDLIGLGALGVAGQAYSEAQRTTYSGMQGSSSTITGSAGSYALGQAVAGGTNEVSKWLLQRLKNSFDAVITPSGHQLVVHLDREIQIDKAPNARKLIHRKQGGLQLARGEHHGLE